MLYLVNKILLLEQLVLGSKEIALIYFAFLHDFTAFADISVFVKYLFFGADVFSLFVIEHIACGSFFYDCQRNGTLRFGKENGLWQKVL